MNYFNCFILFYLIFHFWLIDNLKVVPRSHSKFIRTPRGAHEVVENDHHQQMNICYFLFFVSFLIQLISNVFKYSEFSVLEIKHLYRVLLVDPSFIVSSPYPPFL